MAIVTNATSHKNGLVSASPEAKPPSPINQVRITSPEYAATSVDTRWTPRTNLLTHVEGSAWILDYYSQVLNADSQLSGQQLSASAVYQSYTKICDMEVRVTSALTTSQDDSTKTMTVTGAATLYPFIIPNEGDMFVADIGEGKTGLFRVTNTLKKSIFKEACYEITYGLDTDQADKVEALEKKVVKTVHFHKDFLNYGQNPLLVHSEHASLLELDKVYHMLTRQYFKKFFSNEYQTLLVPGQPSTVYDHFLVDFLLSQYTTWDSPEIRYIRKLNVQDDDAMHCDSLWTALKEKDMSYLNTAFQEAGLTSTRIFTSNPVLEGIRYTGIDKAVYPSDPTLTVDGTLVNPTKPLGLDKLVTPAPGRGHLNQMVRALNLNTLGENIEDDIYPVTKDNYYVLSQAFYDQTSEQSVLEGMVWTYLTGGALNTAQLVTTAKLYTQWGLLEQFYYVPIIMTLIRGVQRGM